MIAAAGTDWLVVSSEGVWSDLAALQLQLRRLAAHPQSTLVPGSPVLRRRIDCLNDDGLRGLLKEWING